MILIMKNMVMVVNKIFTELYQSSTINKKNSNNINNSHNVSYWNKLKQ